MFEQLPQYCYAKVFQDLMVRGNKIKPRGQEVLELEDYQFLVTERFANFADRKLSINYIKSEFLWYLKADPYDATIADSAQIWTDIRQPDGRHFSNYGQYWFGETGLFNWVVDELRRDPDSRRACIPMLSRDHLFADNKDVVCTECITFRVRGGQLNMTVNMRSNDAVWGMCNDIPCFSFLHEMVAVKLGIPVGRYMHKADSMHIYARHYEMAEKILDSWITRFTKVSCPTITDVDDLLSLKFDSPFGRWLTAK